MLYPQQKSIPSQMIGVMIVLAVHVGFILALKNGLLVRAVSEVPKPFIVVPVDPLEPRPLPNPVPKQPVFTQPQIDFIPEPEVPFEPSPDAIQMPMQAPLAPAQESAGNGESTAVTELQVDPRYPLTGPEYPRISLERSEHGTVRLLIYVLPSGRVGEVRISRSSGFPRLDEAAMREAKRSWRFRPATHGGTPVGGWGTYAITFRLVNK